MPMPTPDNDNITVKSGNLQPIHLSHLKPAKLNIHITTTICTAMEEYLAKLFSVSVGLRVSFSIYYKVDLSVLASVIVQFPQNTAPCSIMSLLADMLP